MFGLARADTCAGRPKAPPLWMVGRLVVALMLALSLTWSAAPHFHDHDPPPHDTSVVVFEAASHDVEREGTLLHALFGHNGAGHGGAYGAALPEAMVLAIAATPSRQDWPFTQGQPLTSQDGTTPKRPPRA